MALATRPTAKSVPGHILALSISIVLSLLGLAAGLSGEGEPANLLLGMGVGTLLGSGLVAFSVRRESAKSQG